MGPFPFRNSSRVDVHLYRYILCLCDK